jgi:hypothetical protein
VVGGGWWVVGGGWYVRTLRFEVSSLGVVGGGWYVQTFRFEVSSLVIRLNVCFTPVNFRFAHDQSAGPVPARRAMQERAGLGSFGQFSTLQGYLDHKKTPLPRTLP